MSDIQHITEAHRVTNSSRQVSKLIKTHYGMVEQIRDQGGKVAWCMRGVPEEILFNLNILPAYPENYGSLCAFKGIATPLIEKAEADGFSKDICAYLRVAAGYCHEILRSNSTLSNVPNNGMPKPDMFIAPSRVCDPRVKLFESFTRYFDVPVFIYDMQIPPIDDPNCGNLEEHRHYIEHNYEELWALVRFLENQTKRQLNEQTLRESVEVSLVTWKLYHEIHRMRQNIPCPMPSEDAFHVMWPFLWMPGRNETVQFYKDLQQELQERIDSNVTAAQKEEHRVIWIGLPPYYDMSIFNYLESLGIVSVIETVYYPVRPVEVDTSDPIRAIVERWYWADMGESDGSGMRCGVVGSNLVKQFINQYNVSGAIVHNVRSCRATSVGSIEMARTLRKEFDLPILYLEGDMADIRGYSAPDTEMKLNTFAEVLKSRPKKEYGL